VLRGTGAIFRFGALRSLTLLASNGSDHAVPLILGRMLGFAPVGLYERANGIASRLSADVAGAAMRVLFVALAEAKADRDRLNTLVLVATGNLTAVMWPAFAVLAILAEPLIVLLYGEPWRGAAPVLAWLAVGGMAFVLGLPPYELMTAQGDVAAQLGLECLGTLLKLGLVGALATQGLVPAMLGAAAGMWLLAIATWSRTLYRLELPRRAVLTTLLRSAAMGLAAAAGPALLLVATEGWLLAAWLTLAAGGATAVLGWLLAAIALRHPVYAEVWALLRKVWQPRRRREDRASGSASSPADSR